MIGMGFPPYIKLAPGARLRVILTTKEGTDHVITDVRTPEFLINDDGSEGEKNSGFCWWFSIDATLFPNPERFPVKSEEGVNNG